jgi:hypothetical protein
MYCPVCLNDTLFMHSKGTIFIRINKQAMSTSHFLYNLSKEEEEDIIDTLSEKLDEFLEWYSTFQNKEKISKVEITSANFACDKHCRLPNEARFSVIDALFSKRTLVKILMQISKKHGLSIDVNSLEL